MAQYVAIYIAGMSYMTSPNFFVTGSAPVEGIYVIYTPSSLASMPVIAPLSVIDAISLFNGVTTHVKKTLKGLIFIPGFTGRKEKYYGKRKNHPW